MAKAKYPVTLRLTRGQAVMVRDALDVINPDSEEGEALKYKTLVEAEVALKQGDNHRPRPRTIVVTVKGGIVQDVDGIPEGTVIEVHDYDTDGGSPRDRKDKDGFWYHLGS